MTEGILFAEWAPDTPSARLLGGMDPRTPCPICGHPTGDCTHHPSEGAIMAGKTSTSTAAKSDDKTVTQEAAADQAATVEAQRDGSTNPNTARSALEQMQDRGEAAFVAADGTVESSLYDPADVDEMVTLKQDVVEEFYYPGTARPAYRVLYTKGQTVQKRAIDAYNESVKARTAEPLEGDAAVAAQIDSTTLASGTTPGVEALKTGSDQT